MRGRALAVSSLLLVALGVAVVVRTVQAGAGASFAIGYLLGGGIVLAGIGRLYLVGASHRNPAAPAQPDRGPAPDATVVDVAPDGSFELDGVHRGGAAGDGGAG